MICKEPIARTEYFPLKIVGESKEVCFTHCYITWQAALVAQR